MLIDERVGRIERIPIFDRRAGSLSSFATDKHCHRRALARAGFRGHLPEQVVEGAGREIIKPTLSARLIFSHVRRCRQRGWSAGHLNANPVHKFFEVRNQHMTAPANSSGKPHDPSKSGIPAAAH